MQQRATLRERRFAWLGGVGVELVVEARRRDVRVSEPFLDLCEVCVMFERVGRGRGALGMRSNLDAACRSSWVYWIGTAPMS